MNDEQIEKNERIVENNVYCCVSDLIEELQEANQEWFLDILSEAENYNPEAEIFEYWKVSEWLLKKLEEQGEIVIPAYNIWCRTTTGQAIFLDGVITKIQRGIND